MSADDAELAMHTAAVLREVADVIQAPAKALAGDNTITASELLSIETEIDEAITALLGLKYAARRKANVMADAAVVVKGRR